MSRLWVAVLLWSLIARVTAFAAMAPQQGSGGDRADLAITQTAAPSETAPGGTVTYTIVASNAGPKQARSVTVTDTLPASTTFVSCAATGGGVCAGSGQLRRVTFSRFNTGTSQTITLVVTVKSTAVHGETVVNRATIRATRPTDPVGANNAAVTTVQVVSAPDLSIDQSASPNPVAPDAQITYTLTIRNLGPAAVADVTVTDTLPASTTFASCSATGAGVCQGQDNARAIVFSSIPGGASETVTLVTTVHAGTAGQSVVNTARVASGAADADPSNDAASATVAVGESATRSDIVFIMTDDQAWHTMQFMDRTNALLGDLGVRFTNAFASLPLCCPSRATVLTGLYAHNHQVVSNGADQGIRVFQDASTAATWLKSAGYRTGLVGKYLNKYEFGSLAQWPYVPPGWDDWRGWPTSSPQYYNFDLVENGAVVHYDSTGSSSYLTNVLADHAVRFIETTPAGQPIFLYVTPTAPHVPPASPPEDQNLFETLAPHRPPSYNEADVGDKPSWVRALPLLTAADQGRIDTSYRRQARSLQAVDRLVGAVVDALDRTGRLANAAIVFTSDNGYSLGAHRWEKKHCVYESCVRIPLLVRAPGAQPRTDPSLVSNIDFAPTFAEWAGITPPGPVNGRSLAGLLQDPLTPWRDAVLLEVLSNPVPERAHAVRTAQHKYTEYDNGDRELYDLAADPDELTNVVNDPAYASVVADLDVRLEALKRD